MLPSLPFSPQDQDFYEGERLDHLLQQIGRKIKSARLVDGKSLPEKIWFKQQFAIGVNDMTRVLECMASTARASSLAGKAAAACIQLQAIVIASDCNPRWLSKHLSSLALSGKVPVIFLKDNKGAFSRLGQLLKLKTAIATGVKAKGNAINLLFEEILSGNVMQLGVRTEGLKLLSNAYHNTRRSSEMSLLCMLDVEDNSCRCCYCFSLSLSFRDCLYVANFL